MQLQVIKTTDKKRIGEIFEVEKVDYETCVKYGTKPDSIVWHDNICIVRNSNYTLKLRRLEDG